MLLSAAVLRWLLLLLVLCALQLSFAHGQAVPIRIHAEPSLSLAAAAGIFTESATRLDVAAVAQSAPFRPLTPEDLVPAYDDRVFWLRATLINRNPLPIERWLVLGTPRLEKVSLFQHGPGGWHEVRAGQSVPLQHKPVDAIGVVLPVALDVGETREVLLRIESRTVIDLDASLWQPLDYLRAQHGRLLLQGLSLGGSMIAALVALFLFGRLRERSYLFFVLLHLSAALIDLGRNGLLERFLWPASVPLPLQLHLVLACSVALSLIFLMRNFLDLQATNRRADRLLRVIGSLFLALLPVGFLDYNLSARLFSVLIVVLVAASCTVAVWAWRQGNTSARFLVGAYAILWLVEGLRNLSYLGLYDLAFIQRISASLSLLLATPMIFLALTENTRRLGAELLQVRALVRSKSESLARISHELRAPLNTIIGYARMLGRGSKRLTLQDGSADIERNGLRLLGMIEELLEQSRLDAGQFRLAPQAIALSAWLDELERGGRLLAEAAGNAFALVRSGDFPDGVELDAQRLRQVVDNLLSNAHRHTRHGRIELCCTARVLADGQRVQLEFEVSDNGEGIASEDLPRIFEPFYRGPVQRPVPGVRGNRIGLGLSISRELVRLMGQDLTVSSTSGRGTSFRFGVECRVVAAPPAPLLLPQRSRRQGLRVLVAEEEPVALAALLDLLQALRVTAGGVSSGRRLIEELAACTQGWDAVLTGERFSDGDGWTVLMQVRAQFPALPVVLVSAGAPQPPTGFPATLEFDAVLGQPVQPERLADTLATLLPALPRRKRRTVPQPAALPDPSRLAALAELVAGGQVTAIEEWCEVLAEHHPACADFAAAVQQAVGELDFVTLQRLAGAEA